MCTPVNVGVKVPQVAGRSDCAALLLSLNSENRTELGQSGVHSFVKHSQDIASKHLQTPPKSERRGRDSPVMEL